MSAFFLIIPPLCPKRPIVIAPFFLLVMNAFLMLREFPLVEIPIATSPVEIKLSHCLLKMVSKEKSLDNAVIMDELLVKAIAGKLFLLKLNLPIHDTNVQK